MAFEGAFLALAQVLNLRGYVIQVNVSPSPFTDSGGVDERPSVVVAFIQRMRAFDLIGRFRLAHAANLSRDIRSRNYAQDAVCQRDYFPARGAVSLYLLIKINSILSRNDIIARERGCLSPPPRSWTI